MAKAPEKKTAKPNAPKNINYVNSRVEGSPFNIKIADTTIRPLHMSDGSFVWRVPAELKDNLAKHTLVQTGRIVAEK